MDLYHTTFGAGLKQRRELYAAKLAATALPFGNTPGSGGEVVGCAPYRSLAVTREDRENEEDPAADERLHPARSHRR